MDALEQLRLERELKGLAKPSNEYPWTQAELNEVWRKITAPVLGLMQGLANLPDSLEVVASFQKILPRESGEFVRIAPEQLQEFCGELRAVWNALEKLASENKKLVRGEAQSILHGWWRKYPLKDGPHWNVYFETGTFFPALMNWRALIARVCFDNRDKLGICKNCKKYFIKRRTDSSICLEKGCRLYDNLQRQRKHQEKKNAPRKGRERA